MPFDPTIQPDEQTLVLRDNSAAINWRSAHVEPAERQAAVAKITTVKVSGETWGELLDLGNARITKLWLNSVRVMHNTLEAFCKAFVEAACYKGEMTLEVIESFDLVIDWHQEEKKDYARIAAALAHLNMLNEPRCHLKTLKVYVTVDAGELQLFFWERFFGIPGLATSLEKVVILTNSRNIFATPDRFTLGTYLVRYINGWRNLRELSLHGLWTQVQTVLIQQVRLNQLRLLSISPLPTDGSFALDTHVMKHLYRQGRGQMLGFYGVNGIPDAVRPFSSQPTNTLVIDLTTVRKPNGISIVEELAEAPGPFACRNLVFRRKGSKEPLEEREATVLKAAWAKIIDKVESLIFECKFDFDTSTTKVWDGAFLSLISAISERETPCLLRRLRFEDCLMDVSSTGFDAAVATCQTALEKMTHMMDLHVPLTSQNQARMQRWGLAETVARRQWTPRAHGWCDRDAIRRPFFDVVCAFYLRIGPKYGMPEDVLHLILAQSFKITCATDVNGRPHLTDARVRQVLL